MDALKTFLKTKKKIWIPLTIVIVIVLVNLFDKDTKEAQTRASEQAREQARLEVEALNSNTLAPGQDSTLMLSQDQLTSRFGVAPTGFLWNLDGTLLSLGEESFTPEDTLFAYLRAITFLDLETVGKFSRGSTVLQTYSDFFSSDGTPADDEESFYRNLYKTSMVSLKLESLTDSAVFADNKRVFGVKAEIIDLADKDFWVKDKDTIFETMFAYDMAEGDDTKAQKYLYDYLLNYYSSPEAKTKKVQFDLTLEKYVDLGSGWLVSIDTDLDRLFSYRDGVLALGQIQTEYQDWKISKASEQEF